MAVGAEILTLILTFLAIKLAFWYTNHWDQRKSRKENIRKLWEDMRDALHIKRQAQQPGEEAKEKTEPAMKNDEASNDKIPEPAAEMPASKDPAPGVAVQTPATKNQKEASNNISATGLLASAKRLVSRKRDPAPAQQPDESESV